MSSEKIEQFWENATADDVARVMTGETVEARFWDDEHRGKAVGWLVGWGSGDPCWYCEQTGGRSYFENCQVYREPSWYANKPDPGPGYRLLEKFPDESMEVKDDVFVGGKWLPARWDDGKQSEGIWYRRRIEPVEPKFAVGQTVRVVGPKGKPARHWAEAMDEHIGTVGAVKLPPLQDPEGMFYNIGQIVDWAFREDYLEAVEPVEHYLGKVEAIKQFIVGDTFPHPNGLLLRITAKGFEVTQ
jgi:hypothetical protein